MKALIVVDMQNDFLTGSLANPNAVNIIANIEKLINNSEYKYVVFTQDTHYTDYLSTPEGKYLPIPHCIVYTEGWEISDKLIKAAEEAENIIGHTIVNKPRFGSLQLAEHLEGLDLIDEVTFCGTCTDICVVSNALILKAMLPNLKINVKADCCAGLTPEKHEAALSVMESCQINII